ncbi:MAG: ATP-binding cassette domain-containing protein, partial [Actinomycetota bacterium]|nr:ATP-binding cassette domain-containing protein [Actinomycetota bacterium]
MTAEAVSLRDTGGEILLRARQVTKRFGGLIAVREVDLEIPTGAIVSLIGPNGAGKTTFFNIIAGLTDPTSGRVEFRGQRMVARPVRAWLEPVVWVLPAMIVVAVALLVGAGNAGEIGVAVTAVVAMGLLIVTLLLAIIRPPWYQRLLTRLGIFRSARPNDMVNA